MNEKDEVFMRADIQQIREFLLHGVEENSIDRRPYEERKEIPLKCLTDRLCGLFPEEKEYEEMLHLVYESVGAYEDVAMELGLQVGAILGAQVCQNLKTAFELLSQNPYGGLHDGTADKEG